MATSKTTTDHAEIRKWVEKRGGCPSHVKSTGRKGDAGILRIDFPGYGGKDTLAKMDWDAWFEAFDENRLAFVYDTDPKSRFSKLVSRSARRPARKATATGAKRTATKARGAKRTAAPRKKTAARRSGTKKRASSARARSARA